MISETGKKHETYRSRIKDAGLNFSSGEVSIDVMLVPGGAYRKVERDAEDHSKRGASGSLRCRLIYQIQFLDGLACKHSIGK